MWKILSIVLLALWPLSVLALDSCLLPAGTPALCVPIDNCRHIRELFKTLQSPLPPNVGFLIRDSYFCTNQGGNDLNVCCPLEGIETPANPKPNIVKKGKISLLCCWYPKLEDYLTYHRSLSELNIETSFM